MTSLSVGPPLASPTEGGLPVHATLNDALKHVAATAPSSQGITYDEGNGKPTFESYAALLQLPDAPMVAAVWRASPPLPLPSMFPKSVVYTSGSSGYKATGLVQVGRSLIGLS